MTASRDRSAVQREVGASAYTRRLNANRACDGRFMGVRG
jgi:hypothetical protein